MGKRRGNGEGTIYKRQDGRWCAQLVQDITAKRITVYGKNRKEVQDKLRQLINEQELGVITRGHITLTDWITIYLNDYKKPLVRESTLIRYESIFNLHIKPALGQLELKKLQTGHLQRFYNSLGEKLSLSVLKLAHTLLLQSLKQAAKEGLISRNVAANTLLPRKEKRAVTAIGKEDIARFIKINKQEKYFLPVFLALTTGLRRGEVLVLLWENVDLQQGYLDVKHSLSLGRKGKVLIVNGKTEKAQRTVPLPQELIKQLKEHKRKQLEQKLKIGSLYQDSHLLFTKANGTALTTACLHKHFKQMLKRANLSGKIRFHDLRHTYATMLLEAGENPKVIQELLGHANISTTMDIYSHVTSRLKRKAVQRLDNILEELG